MTLKHDLLARGYLPEGLPPTFTSESVATYFAPTKTGFLSPKEALRPATYNASKRGLTRRVFSAVHPLTAFDLAQFISIHERAIDRFFGHPEVSLSIPDHTPDGQRAVKITSHTDLEGELLHRLAGYRFIAKTDISRFYHSIYTHSNPWAFHGKDSSKKDRKGDSASVFLNRLDFIIRQGQDGQTIGIPVGPDASRYIAEIVATAVDREFAKRNDGLKLGIIRHVDDVWIGAHSHADVEQGLWRYREALRQFELDINETKTRIFEKDFRFSDTWPSEILSRLEAGLKTEDGVRSGSRLRAALEYAFNFAVSQNDDGVLRYVIRQIDRNSFWNTDWQTLEPFLIRVAVHFGHTIDFVSRLVVWRKLTADDLDEQKWADVFNTLLERHYRLGNDNEVCWCLFALLRFKFQLPAPIALDILSNCGAMSIVSLLHCASAGLVNEMPWDNAVKMLSPGSDLGPLWPVFLEWRGNKWPSYRKIAKPSDDGTIVDMAVHGVRIFSPEGLPRVFKGVDPHDFPDIEQAIEKSPGGYEGEES